MAVDVLSSNSVGSVVVTAAAQVALTADQVWDVVSNTNMWFKLGANPTAAVATTGSVYLPANQRVRISTGAGAVKISILRDTADGFVTITQLM